MFLIRMIYKNYCKEKNNMAVCLTCVLFLGKPNSIREKQTMSVTLKEIRKRREEILKIAQYHGAKNVRVFGSVARGETRPDSDLDLLVEFESGRSLFDLGGLVVDIEELIGCKVDVISENGLRSRFRNRVIQEAIAI
jgi:uncharacterized protein